MTGQELRRIREELGYATQDLFARELQVSRPTISAWERRTDRLDRVIELAVLALARNPELRTIGGGGVDSERRIR